MLSSEALPRDLRTRPNRGCVEKLMRREPRVRGIPGGACNERVEQIVAGLLRDHCCAIDAAQQGTKFRQHLSDFFRWVVVQIDCIQSLLVDR